MTSICFKNFFRFHHWFWPLKFPRNPPRPLALMFTRPPLKLLNGALLFPRIIAPPRFPRKFPWKFPRWFGDRKLGGAIPSKLGGVSVIWFIFPSSVIIDSLWIQTFLCWFMSLSGISGGGGRFILTWCGNGNIFCIEKSRWSARRSFKTWILSRSLHFTHHHLIQRYDCPFLYHHQTFPCRQTRHHPVHSFPSMSHCSCSCFYCSGELKVLVEAVVADYGWSLAVLKCPCIQTLTRICWRLEVDREVRNARYRW